MSKTAVADLAAQRTELASLFTAGGAGLSPMTPACAIAFGRQEGLARGMTLLAVSTAVWVFILVPLIIVWALGVTDIVRRDLSGSATLGWILIVVLLPLLGTLVYFLLRKPTEKEVRRAEAAAAEQRGSWPEGVPR
jgi:phospholipase D-like protein